LNKGKVFCTKSPWQKESYESRLGIFQEYVDNTKGSQMENSIESVLLVDVCTKLYLLNYSKYALDFMCSYWYCFSYFSPLFYFCKLTLNRDFRPLVFFCRQTTSTGPLIYTRKPLFEYYFELAKIFVNICCIAVSMTSLYRHDDTAVPRGQWCQWYRLRRASDDVVVIWNKRCQISYLT
jgi:hypothetical protein